MTYRTFKQIVERIVDPQMKICLQVRNMFRKVVHQLNVFRVIIEDFVLQKLFIKPKLEVIARKMQHITPPQNDPADVQSNCVLLPAEDTSFTSCH